MSITLLNLAHAYEREASRFRTSDRARDELRQSAALFRRMLSNRAAADPNQLTIHLWMLIDVIERWCRQHGYRSVAGYGGYIIQRSGEPVIVATFGDTLRWDGEQLNVEN